MSDPVLAFLNSPLGVALGFMGGMLPVLVVFWLLNRWATSRDLRRVHEITAYYQRQRQLDRQLWQMEEQIREERLSEEEREWRRRYREEQAEVKREARRRLGLPEEPRS